MERYTINHFNEDFPDDSACLEFLVRQIYPDGIPCRNCGEITKHHRLKNRPKAYSCDRCGTHVYLLAGTIFEKSRTSLKSWFYAMYIMSSTRSGISAKQLERELGVTYKTAHRMFKQIRSLLGEEVEKLSGEVEADEMYIGGRRRGGRKGRPSRDSHKTPVFGMIQRGGKVAALVTKDTTANSLGTLIKEHVLPESLIYTDEWKAYSDLKYHGYRHKRIPHSQKVYVIGRIHTNSVEGFWSILKRGIAGVYHSVSAKHLQSYVNEYAFRYNHRDDHQTIYKTIVERVRDVPAGHHGKYSPVKQQAAWIKPNDRRRDEGIVK